ncbi:hypothetical protein [Bradyrhizobium guangzhouense]|uniref:hypothetical protein n=1 Tax=Bradyrhizobium guangzhouense TaxID=1325095 RepID=UPI001FE1274A|nr:hypothetical protein [Bradyrhizobium guangzhouense]
MSDHDERKFAGTIRTNDEAFERHLAAGDLDRQHHVRAHQRTVAGASGGREQDEKQDKETHGGAR